MRIISSLRLVFLFLPLLVVDSSVFAQNLPNTTRLLRFPAINDRQIVFVYAGELYTVPKDGGTARRLTSGPGYSSFPVSQRMARSSRSPRSMTVTPRST